MGLLGNYFYFVLFPFNSPIICMESVVKYADMNADDYLLVIYI